MRAESKFLKLNSTFSEVKFDHGDMNGIEMHGDVDVLPL